MDAQKVEAGIVQDAEHNLVHFGAIVDGVFHSFGAIRHGDFTEAQQAGQQAQQQAQQAQAQPQQTTEGQ